MVRARARQGAGPAAVLSDIAAGRFEKLYLLAGPDRAAADDIVAALKKALVTPGFEAFDLETAYAGDGPVDTVIEHARQAPMASTRRLVILREAEKLRAPEFKALLEGLERLPDGNTLAVTLDPDTTKKKALTASGLERWIVDLGQPGAEDLPGLVNRWARERKLELEPAALRLLLEMAGTDTATLRGELDKFALGLDEGARVTAQLVRRYAARSRTAHIRGFVTRLMTLETGAALAELEQLKRLGEKPVTILFWLEGGFMELAQLHAGRLNERAAWRTRDFRGKWRDAAMVRRCLLQLYEVHKAAVSGGNDPFTMLAQFTYCAACRQPEECAVFGRVKRPGFCVRRLQQPARKMKSKQ
jgi:DNA polymerase-3 subunit delta